MEMNIRKLALSAFAACSLVSSVVADQMDSDTMINRSSCEETNFREITPNAGPRVTNGVDVFFTADFIYWTARQDGLPFARSGLVDYSEASVLGNTPQGQTYYADGKFSPGFKVGAGLNLGHDGWDTYLNYTWLHCNHSQKVISTNASALSPVSLWEVATVGNNFGTNNFLVLGSFLNIGSATGKWAYHFNNFDLELGRSFYISQYLTLRPFSGLKGTWSKQFYDVSYGNFLSSDVASDVSSTVMNARQAFWGIGVRTGLDTSWYFDRNWSIFGNTALAALWGRFNNTRQDTVNTTGNQSFMAINTKNQFHTVKPVAEFQLGLRYDYWFSDDDYHFGIELAWEEQVWFNQNQYIDLIQPAGPHGDLILQGFTLDLRFDF